MIKRLITLMVLAIVMLSAKCKKNDVQANGLPNATQSGKNTFGALVDGLVFLPDGGSLSFHPKLIASYGVELDHHVLNIKTSNLNVSGLPGFVFQGDSVNLKTGDQFSLVGDGSKTDISARYYAYATDYNITAPLTGTITFTRVDTQAKILSGIFNFDAINTQGHKISVTEGRFDITYN